MSICKSCGIELSSNDLFCTSCGMKTEEQKDNSENLSTTEKQGKNAVLMVLNINKKEGLFKTSNCYLIFFEDKVVISILTKEKQNIEIRKVQEQNKAEGKGFFKGAAAMMSYWSNYGNRYYSMKSEEILKEESSNSMIAIDNINKIIFKTADYANNNQDMVSSSSGNITIQYGQEKIKASHKYYDTNKNIKKVLSTLFDKKLKYKSRFKISIPIGVNKKEGFY